MRERYKRQSFLGPDSEKVFADCTACLVGLGGGGSHLAQQLAHLGLGNFRLIDPDSVEESNLNRLVGATAEDAAKSSRKTAVASRLITNVNPHARVEVTSKKWQECHQLLRDCDVVFGCVDAYRDRHELEITARRYLIPYIDIGMDVYSIGDKFSVSGQVILSMPGALCMKCLGFLRDDLLAKEAENYGAAGDQPQVVWANGVLASIAVGVFTQLLAPWHATQSQSVYLEYDGNAQTVGVSRRLEYMEGRKCSHFSHLHDLGDPFWVPEKVG
jgi:molybdopterin-synthase adenylyltransferase